jgi:hypothetical protein
MSTPLATLQLPPATMPVATCCASLNEFLLGCCHHEEAPVCRQYQNNESKALRLSLACHDHCRLSRPRPKIYAHHMWQMRLCWKGPLLPAHMEDALSGASMHQSLYNDKKSQTNTGLTPRQCPQNAMLIQRKGIEVCVLAYLGWLQMNLCHAM